MRPLSIAALILAMPVAAAGAEECGRLTETSRYSDLNKILDCIERKASMQGAAPAAARPEPRGRSALTCLAEDDQHPLVRGCVTSISARAGAGAVVQVVLENKTGNSLAVVVDNAVHVCGIALGDNAGNHYRSGVCPMPQLSRHQVAGAAGLNLLYGQGTAVSPGSRLSRAFTFTRDGSAEAGQWSLDIELQVAEDSEAVRKGAKATGVTLSFPAISERR